MLIFHRCARLQAEVFLAFPATIRHGLAAIDSIGSLSDPALQAAHLPIRPVQALEPFNGFLLGPEHLRHLHNGDALSVVLAWSQESDFPPSTKEDTHSGSLTTLPPRVQTNTLMGYTDEAMYWGIRCFDAHPESLVVLPFEDKDDANRKQDIISLFFDRNRDRKTISVMLINSEGYVRDGYDDYNKSRQRDHSWDADGTAATYVGDDYWSVEFELRWDPKYNPPPAPGDVSGLDIPRLFRGGVEWSQPFRGYGDLNAPGYLVYR